MRRIYRSAGSRFKKQIAVKEHRPHLTIRIVESSTKSRTSEIYMSFICRELCPSDTRPRSTGNSINIDIIISIELYVFHSQPNASWCELSFNVNGNISIRCGDICYIIFTRAGYGYATRI
ncbi:hypothetical protein G6K67_004724 [Salmonella enterica subsp. enterica serovar Rubislaw]|nr:hypothetical protein [Salmonella enterica subsp. enterica serovar Rubislaw]